MSGLKCTRRDGGRGLLLLELVFALAVFVSIGTLIMASIRQAVMSTQTTRDLVRAEDFAASVLALISADLETPDGLNGELPEWDSEDGYFGGGSRGGGARAFVARSEQWAIEIDTGAAGVPGFTSVVVRVKREDRQGVSVTREALVRLGGGGLAGLEDGRRRLDGRAAAR